MASPPPPLSSAASSLASCTPYSQHCSPPLLKPLPAPVSPLVSSQEGILAFSRGKDIKSSLDKPIARVLKPSGRNTWTVSAATLFRNIQVDSITHLPHVQSTRDIYSAKTASNSTVIIKVGKNLKKEIAIMQFLEFSKVPNTLCLLDTFNTCFLFDPGSILDALVFPHGGATLGHAVRKTPFILEQVYNFSCTLFTTLSALHNLGCVHADLQTGNVLVCDTFKLIDFGETRALSDPLTGLITMRYYRAPEVVLGYKEVGTAIDSWAMGCLIYFTLMGHHLFAAENDGSLLPSIIAEIGEPPATFLAKGAQEDVEEYFSSVDPPTPRTVMLQPAKKWDKRVSERIRVLRGTEEDEMRIVTLMKGLLCWEKRFLPEQGLMLLKA